MTQPRRVAIVGGNRIPFARSNTVYATASNQEMLISALDGLVERFNLHGERLGEVVAGAVLKHSRDFNLTRECVLGSRLAPETPAYDLQQACGTGLEAALLVANKIALGQIECGIAGGVDTTSDAPIGVNEGLRKILLQANRGKSTGEKIKSLLQIRPRHLAPAIPRNGEPRTGLSMGAHCELMAQTWAIPRDEQDQLAVASHQKLAAAYAEAARHDPMVIAERGILGGEYTVAILGEQALPIIKIEPATEFYDYDAKYLRDDTAYRCPCGLSGARELELRAQALEAFRVLGGRGWGRVDFLMDEAGAAYFLEANTSPGMTDHSLVPMAARVAGISYDELVLRVLALAALG